MSAKLDRRVARTRATLLRALMELIAKKGYDDITVQDILDRANVGRSTFYTHYRNKNDLLVGPFKGRVLNFGREGDHPLIPCMTLAFEHAEQNYRFYHGIVRTEGLTVFMDNWRERLIIDWQERFQELRQTGLEPEIPAEVASRFLAGALVALTTWWLDAGMPHPPKEMDRMFRDMAARGLDGLRQAKADDGTFGTGSLRI